MFTVKDVMLRVSFKPCDKSSDFENNFNLNNYKTPFFNLKNSSELKSIYCSLQMMLCVFLIRAFRLIKNASLLEIIHST